ncbi:MAG: flagellar protein [Lachnospiraceae bacterium]|nr:flagellar protein [Lachnospiraceae bacterium]
MNGINQTFLSSAQIMDRYITAGKVNQSQETSKSNSFQEALLEAMDSSRETTLKFSKHATSRLADRNIELTKEQMDRLTEGTNKAGSKGIRDSLVMVDHLAFIVNIPKNTVITAMDQSQADENIFTNIDGAVIA